MIERMPDIIGIGRVVREDRRKAEHKRKEAEKKLPVFDLAETGEMKEGKEKKARM